MKVVTLYTVQAQDVTLGDDFSVSRSPSIKGPRHSLGNGYVLLGINQQPRGTVTDAGAGRYIALAPELRDLLERPIRAEFEHDLERVQRRADALAAEVELMRATPWPVRALRELLARWSGAPSRA
jgi:hypothetical protein